MAIASIWDVCELKMNVLSCLRDDRCDADLARCARVHRSWTEFALDALWFGYPGTNCQENRMRTTALPSLPRSRRQEYASRLGVLVFNASDGVSVHADFDNLEFPRLKEVVLYNLNIWFLQSGEHSHQLLRYLQPTLESLRLTDDFRNRPKWLTASFLTEVARRCPSLKEISIMARYVPTEPADLALFLSSIRPQAVTLGFEQEGQMLTSEVLSAVSESESLTSLDLVGIMRDYEEVKLVELQRFLSVTSKPFANLTHLGLFLEAEAVPLLALCFPAVTWLRLGLNTPRRDDFTLEPLASMSQLQYLEISGGGDKAEDKLPARAFIGLGSVTQLKSLKIGTSFFPSCMSQDDSVEPEAFDPRHKFTRADASVMFSRLTALEHLSIFIGAAEPDHLYDYISKHCSKLSSIELVGEFDPQHLVQAHAPVLVNVRKMSIEDIKASMSPSRVARLIYDFVPKLEKLSSTGEYLETFETHQIYTAWENVRSTQNSLKNGKGP